MLSYGHKLLKGKKERGLQKMKRVHVCASVACFLGAVCFVDVTQGEGFPAVAEDGVLTLTVPGEYADAVPGGVTKLVVDAKGEVTLATEEAYGGSVEIRFGSTLKVPNRTVLAHAPITVKDGGTLYPTFESKGQWVKVFLQPITIAGAGNGGIGAFKYGGAGKVMADAIVSTLVLSADATIDCSVRWGVAGVNSASLIDLAGHTLTRIGNGEFMFISATMTPGTFKNTAGKLTFQLMGPRPFGVAEGHTGDETLIHMTGGTFAFWNTASPVPYKVRLSGGNIIAGSGVGPTRNLISGPVEIENSATIVSDWMGTSAKRLSYGFVGPLTIANQKALQLANDGTLYLGGPIQGELAVSDLGLISITAEDAGAPRFVMRNGRFMLDADRALSAMFRCANGAGSAFGAFHHKRGDLSFMDWDFPRIGELSGSFGTYTFDAGGFYPSNSVYLAERAGSRGFFLQRGGHAELQASAQWDWGKHLRIAGCDAQACFVQTGGTNDMLSARVADNAVWRTLFGAYGGTNLLFALSGSNTVYRTDGFAFGCSTNRTTGVIAVNDGASFKVRRFGSEGSTMFDGTDVTLSLNGGVLYPLFFSGWANMDPDDAGFLTKRVPQHVIVGPKGVTLDTSECLSKKGEPGSSFVPLTFTAPEGQGLASIEIPAEAANVAYYGAVAVEIEGPAGSYGASAYGDWDETANRLKRIVVTSSGCNYDETTKVYVRGPTSGATRYECAYALTGAQTSGPLVKRGANAVSLYGANTYTGGTVVEAGTLAMRGEGSFPANTALKVMDGAAFENEGRALAVSSLSGAGGLVRKCANALSVGEALEISVAELFAASGPLTVDAKVTFAEGAAVRVTDPENLPAHQQDRSRPFLKATGGFAGPIPKLTLTDATGRAWKVLRSGDTLRFGPEWGAVMLVR